MGNTSVKPHPRSRNKKQVHWKAADRPSPPGKPQLVSETEITPDVVTIRWDPPRFDGGSPITGYLVEHRRYGSPHWVRATPLLVPFTQLSLSGLEPGWRYQFRISAENAVGLSAPGELSELLTVTLQRSAVTVPRFIDELQDTIALENEKIEFVAQFLGQPVPKISWFKDGFEIFSSRRIRIISDNDKSILTIHQCSLSDEGEIKCTATNRAGHVSTKAKLTLEAPPSIRLPRQYEDGLLFELGEVIRLKVSIAGRPTPLVFWTHNNESIKSDDHYELESTDKYSGVRIAIARRTDRGEYQIKAVNKLGEAISSFLVTVTHKPSPPGQARVIMTLGRSVTLSWSVPGDDGGCKIGNYIVEYFRIGWDVWLKAVTCRQLSTTIGELIEGSEYKFRVKAESPYGVSDPSIESDVVFIPDPKRGILTPSQRSKSQPRDIISDSKKPPMSPTSPRAEALLNRTPTPVHFYEGGVPTRPARTKIKSPSITPDVSPVPTRRFSNKNIFDRASMARDLAYGTPEITYESEKLNNAPSVVVKSTVNVIHVQNPGIKDRTPSPFRLDQKSPENVVIESQTARIKKTPSPVINIKRTPSPVPQLKLSPTRKSPSSNYGRQESKPPMISRSPSPTPLRPPETNGSHTIRDQAKRPSSPAPQMLEEINKILQANKSRNKSPSPLRYPKSRSPSPNLSINHSGANSKYNINLPESPRNKSDHLSNSSEFILVLLPETDRGRENPDIKFDFEEHSVPPPISLSAPELGAEPLVFEPLRLSVSSSELLHDQSMARLYEAIEAEENKVEQVEEFSNVPKIQITSNDQAIVGLERKNSLRRRLSGGGLTVPQQLLWAQRRHSLKNAPDLTDIPENSLRKFPENLDGSNVGKEETSVVEKRHGFRTRQRSESEEREEEEFEKVRLKMAARKKEHRKAVGVVKEEEWDEVAQEELHHEYEENLSESDSSEGERLRQKLPPIYVEDEEEEIYHPREMRQQMNNKLKLKRSIEPFEILTKPSPLPNPNFIPKPILKHRDIEEIPDKPVRKNTNTNKSPERRPTALSRTNNPAEARIDIDKSTAKPQPSFSLFPQSTSPKPRKQIAATRKRGRSPTVSHRTQSTVVASGIKEVKPSPKPIMQNRKTDDEIRVVVDHYGDIVKSYGHKSRSIPKVYLNAEDLKAAAEKQSADDLRDINKSDEDLSSPEALDENYLQGLNFPNETRRRSFVLEASSALLRTVKEKFSAALAANDQEFEDDVIPPEAEIVPQVQRRGSAQLRKRISKSPNKMSSKKGAPASSESNWSNLRSPSPGPQGRKISPTSSLRRNSFTLIPASVQLRRTSLSTASVKPKMRETTTQTPGDDPKKDILYAALQEELSAKVEHKVRTTVDYVTDLAMFIVACWLFLFQNELLAIPVLLVMVYRQLQEEIKKKLPAWMTGKKKIKRK